MKFVSNVLILCCLFPFSVNAMDLTLEQAVEKIVKASEDIKKADANIVKMQAVLDQVNSSRWFNIEGSATYMNNINVKNPGETEYIKLSKLDSSLSDFGIPNNFAMLGVSITQPIYTFGKIGNAVEAARDALSMSKYQREIYVREMTYAAVQMYLNAKASDGLVRIAESSLAKAEKSEKLLKDSGAQRSVRSNLIKVSADIASRRPVLDSAKLNQEQAYRMLRVFAEIPENETINLVTDFSTDFKTFEIDNLKTKLDLNPKYSLLNSQINYYENLAKSKKAGHNPSLVGTAGYDYFAGYTDLDMWHGFKNQAATIGLTLSVPLFDGGLANAQATQEFAEATKSMEDLKKSKKELSMQLENAVSQYDRLKQIYSAELEAKVLAEKAYELSLDRFATGQTSATELNDVEQSLTIVDRQLLNTLYQISLTEAEIQKLTGDYSD